MTENEKVEELIRIAREGKIVRILGRGNSMRPLLLGDRDYVYLRTLEDGEQYSKGDVVLYWSGGIYIMHRILRIVPEGYIMLGDGNQELETPIPSERIYLKAEGFLRDGKYISTKRTGYKIYVMLWGTFWRFRPFVRRCKWILNDIFRKGNRE